MKRYSVFYFIGQAVRGLWRNGVMTFASIAVLMSCLVVIGGFSLLVYNIDVNLESFGLLNEVVVSLDYELSEDEIVAIGDKLSALDNVESVTRITKDEAIAEIGEDYNTPVDDITSGEEANPLSDEYRIVYTSNDKVAEMEYQINQIEGVRNFRDMHNLSVTIENFKSGVMMIFTWFLAILAVVSVFIIVNTIKLSVFARRHEISVMRYVGATGWFITLPFLIEGTIIGLLASAVAYFVEWYFYGYIVNVVMTDMQMITIVPFAAIQPYVLWGFIGLGILTGIIGSSISLGKYLKQ